MGSGITEPTPASSLSSTSTMGSLSGTLLWRALSAGSLYPRKQIRDEEERRLRLVERRGLLRTEVSLSGEDLLQHQLPSGDEEGPSAGLPSTCLPQRPQDGPSGCGRSRDGLLRTSPLPLAPSLLPRSDYVLTLWRSRRLIWSRKLSRSTRSGTLYPPSFKHAISTPTSNIGMMVLPMSKADEVAKALTEFQVGDRILFPSGVKWLPGEIVEVDAKGVLVRYMPNSTFWASHEYAEKYLRFDDGTHPFPNSKE